MKLLLVLFLVLYPHLRVRAQIDFNKKISLDTIFFIENTDDFISNTDVFNLDWHPYRNDLYFFSPKQKNKEDSDSLFFTKFNILNGERLDFALVTPELYIRDDYPNSIKSFCLNATSFHIGYQQNMFGTFVKNSAGRYSFSFFTPIKGIFYQDIYSHNDCIYLFNSYRTIELKSNWNYIYRYDLKKHIFLGMTYFDFKHPEFSYYQPNHWFDFYKGQSVLSQTVKYEVSLYDSSLNLKRVIKREDIQGWVNFTPTHLLDTALKIKDNGGNISVVLGYLKNHINNIARVERVHFIDEKTLMVCYYVPTFKKHSDGAPAIRKVDIWDLEQGVLKYQDMKIKEGIINYGISDYNYSFSDTLTQNDFPLFVSDGLFHFFPDSKKMIIIRVGGRYEKYLNVTFEDLKSQEDKYLEENEFLIQVFVYSLNF